MHIGILYTYMLYFILQGSSVILYISLATDPELLTVIKGYANTMITHYNV